MKIKILLKGSFIFLALLFTFSIFLAGMSYDSNLKIIVKIDNAKIRFKPSFESSVVTTVSKGEILEMNKREGEWYRVTLPSDKSGFALSGYIHQSEGDILREKPIKEKVVKETSKRIITEDISKPVVMERTAPNHLRYSVSGKILYTTADLKYEYEIIGVATHYQELGISLTFRDPLEGAIKEGMKRFEKKVIGMGGDAVVGLRYNFANRTVKDEGRLLIYGTVVKFK